jgi:hypothetical protein
MRARSSQAVARKGGRNLPEQNNCESEYCCEKTGMARIVKRRSIHGLPRCGEVLIEDNPV